MFLMPSRYEPCGLNQIYSLRHGTVAIVRLPAGLMIRLKRLISSTAPEPASSLPNIPARDGS